MKIIDKTGPVTGEPIDYDFGDVIKCGKDLYTIITGKQGNFGVFNLTSLRTETWYDSMADLDDVFGLSHGQKVDATLTIE